LKFVLRAALALSAFALVVPTLGVVAPAGTTVPGADAAVRQGGTTILMPAIVQPGAKVAAANKARLTGKVKFRPIRKGRPVVIQRRVGKGPWQKVATKRQNGRGVVEFVAPARNAKNKFFTYRGVAQPWNGLKQIAAKPQSAGVWKMKFNDEFKGTSLNQNRWSYRHLGVYSENGDRACSASAKDAVKVGGGRVQLMVKPDGARQRQAGDCVSYDKSGKRYTNRHWYKNGHISTAEASNGRFRYGVAAARVKFDKPVGAHGSFWMQTTVPYQAGQGPAKNGAEIDVVEYFGKAFKKGDIYSFIHYKDAQGKDYKVPDGVPITAARKALKGDDDWFKKYHVFSVEWTPKAYVFRVDGIQTLRVTKGVSKVPEFLILSMLSSGWELEKMDRKTLPNSSHVDWVRYWQK
jgi:beta-glucanase (GH16 family)